MAVPQDLSPGPSTGLAATVLAVSSLTVMANATISPSLPGLAAAFAETPGIELLAGLVLSLPSLSILLTAPLFGRLAARLDRRAMFLGLLSVYAAAGASGALAHSIGGILVGRVLLGVAVAGTMTLATTLAGEHWQGAARERLLGRQSAAMAAGGILFLLFGGLLAEWSWRGPFLIYLAALPLLWPAWRWVPPHGPAAAAMPVQDPPPFPWRFFLGIGAAAMFAMTMFYLVPTRLPFLLAELGVPAPSAAGLAIAAMTFASMLASLAFERVRRQVGPLMVFVLAYSMMAIGYGLVGTATAYAEAVAGTLLAGFGLGLAFPNQSAWLMARTPEPLRSRAAGLLTSAIFTGQILSPALSGVLSVRLSTGSLFLVFGLLLALVALALALAGRPARRMAD